MALAALARVRPRRGPRALSLALFVAVVLATSAVGQPLPDLSGPEPPLVVTSHEDGARVVRRVLRLRGRTTLPPDAVIAVTVVGADGGRDVRTATRSGEGFSAFCLLARGDNRVEVTAAAPEGPSVRQSLTITWDPPTEIRRERVVRIESPRDGEQVPSAVLRVDGVVEGAEDGDEVQAVLAGPGGARTKQVAVRGGRFRVWFVVTDAEGSLTVSAGDAMAQASFRCLAPKVPEGASATPSSTSSQVPPLPGTPTPTPTGPAPTVAPTRVRRPLAILEPADGAILPAAALRVTGAADPARFTAVLVRLLADGGDEEKTVPVDEGVFHAWFVLRRPTAVVTVEALDGAGVVVAEDAVDVRCARPRGWTGPLPWEDDAVEDAAVPQAGTGRHEPGQVRRPGPGGPRPASSRSDEDVLDWRLLGLPFLVVLAIPLAVRLPALGRGLMRRLLGVQRRNAAVTCDFCRAEDARRYFLFALSSKDAGHVDLVAGLVACAGLTSNDEVNESLRPLLQTVQSLAAGMTGGDLPVWCVWCRGCASGFLLVGEGASARRHTILTPVFFDWLLVTLGLNG